MGFYEDEDAKKDLKTKVPVLWLFIVAVYTIGYFGLLAGEGITVQEYLLRYIVYFPPLILYGVFVTVVKYLHANGKAKWLVSFIHDTERSIFPKSWKPISNPVQLIFFSYIAFGSLALFASFRPQTAVWLFPFKLGTLQQVTETTNTIFQVYPSSPAENGALWIILSVLVSLQLYIMYKAKVDESLKKWIFWLVCVPINTLLSAKIWGDLHVLVSGSSEPATNSHLFFGGINALITQITGSIIPSQAYHDTNNLFLALVKYFGGVEIARYIIIGILVTLFILGILYFRYADKDDD